MNYVLRHPTTWGRPLGRCLFVVTLALLLLRSAFAFDPFVVRDIRVEGAQRIAAGTVFNYLPVRVGQELTNDKASEAIRALYATGFFRDVRLEVDGDVLVVYLSERPAIAKLEITGTKEFKADALKETLRDVGLETGRIFDRSVLERAEQALKRQYLSRGKYGVQVSSTTTPLERNRVGINLAVTEGGSARIASIRFVGNKVFSDSTLRDEIRLTTPNWVTWYSDNDQYAQEKLAGDLETIRSYYLDRGYLQFSIESTQVSITPDKEDVHITIVLKEGEQFKVTGVGFEGNTLGREDEFKQLLEVKDGDTFSGTRLNETRRRVVERLGELGYAFANVNAQPQIDKEKREVSFNFLIDPGRRVYVRRISISGNSRTRDTVVRREMRQFEDAWYDVQKIRESRERIGRLGYFSDVRIETEPVSGTADQVNLLVKVKENPTGNILFGVGTSSTEPVILSATLNQQNFLGSGKSINLDFNTSAVNRNLSLSYTDPYFTQSGVSRTFSAYSRLFDANELNLGDYRWRSNGIGLRFGMPYTNVDRLFFGLSAENNQLDLGAAPPQRYLDFVNGSTDPDTGEFVPGVGKSSSALLGNLGWRRDTRDSAFAPTSGRLQDLNLEFTFPIGDLRYYKATYKNQWYRPLSKNYTLAANIDLGYAQPLGGRRYAPFKNFFAGGIGSVRGYSPSSLGPGRDPVDNVALGGQTKVVGSLELIMPFAGTGSDRSFRWFLFLDGGNVFPGNQVNVDLFKYSAGIGLTWLSPIGPMKFSLGYPLNREPGDSEQRLQFQIGTGF